METSGDKINITGNAVETTSYDEKKWTYCLWL